MATCKGKGTGDRGQQVYFLLRSLFFGLRDGTQYFVLGFVRFIFVGILGNVRYFSLQTGRHITMDEKKYGICLKSFAIGRGAWPIPCRIFACKNVCTCHCQGHGHRAGPGTKATIAYHMFSASKQHETVQAGRPRCHTQRI